MSIDEKWMFGTTIAVVGAATATIVAMSDATAATVIARSVAVVAGGTVVAYTARQHSLVAKLRDDVEYLQQELNRKNSGPGRDGRPQS